MLHRCIAAVLICLASLSALAQDVFPSEVWTAPAYRETPVETGEAPWWRRLVQDPAAAADAPSPPADPRGGAQPERPGGSTPPAGEAALAAPMVPIPTEEIPAEGLTIPTIDLTAPADDVWERIRNGFAMPNLDTDLVSEQQAWYLNRPAALKRMFDRARPFLYHIVEEIEKRGLPTELALLPMVESAFNPMAYSPAHASGLWQFIPSTGRNFGLTQNWWSDERRDILASTEAALEYLTTIYDMHGDWHLALASYNWGENAVARSISRNQAAGRPTDYASLEMPAETRHYVPKLQALKNIIAQPELFSLELSPIPNRPYFKRVAKPLDIDLALAAKLADVPVDELRALNPAHNRPVIRASEGPSLVLPAGKVDAFLRNVSEHRQPLVSWRTYTVQRREKLETVAARLGVSAARLREINGLGQRSRLAPGATLLVPASANTSGSLRLAEAAPEPPSARKGSPSRRDLAAPARPAKKLAAKPQGAKKSASSGPSRKGAPAALQPRARK